MAPRIRYCDARGPAPQLSQSLMNWGESAPLGRVPRGQPNGVLDHVVGDRDPAHEILIRDDLFAGQHVVELGGEQAGG